MRCHLSVVQFHFTYEELPSFLFTPRTNHFHNASWSGKATVEYEKTDNRQISIIMSFTDPTASCDEKECGEIHTEGVGLNIQKSLHSTDARSVRRFSALGGHGIFAVGQKLALDWLGRGRV